MDNINNHACKNCGRVFTLKSNLKRHISEIHSSQPKSICHLCAKAFTSKSNLIRHISKCSNDEIKKRGFKEVQCVLCKSYKDLKISVLKHYSEHHDINIITENLCLPSFLEFEKWKDEMEKETVSKYIRHDSIKTNDKTMYYYKCHRDGFYRSEGKNIRRLKLKGSNKINGYCPARIDVSVSKATGEVRIQFLKTHVGHTMDLDKIPLKKVTFETCEDTKSLVMEEDYKNFSDEEKSMLKVLGHSEMHMSDINQYKIELCHTFQNIMDTANTIEQCKVIDEALIHRQPTLALMEYSQITVEHKFVPDASASPNKDSIK